MLQSSFLFALPWSLGALIDLDGRVKFDQYIRDLLAGKMEDHPVPKSVGKIEVPFPDTGLVYDYCYEVKCHRSSQSRFENSFIDIVYNFFFIAYDSSSRFENSEKYLKMYDSFPVPSEGCCKYNWLFYIMFIIMFIFYYGFLLRA